MLRLASPSAALGGPPTLPLPDPPAKEMLMLPVGAAGAGLPPLRLLLLPLLPLLLHGGAASWCGDASLVRRVLLLLWLVGWQSHSTKRHTSTLLLLVALPGSAAWRTCARPGRAPLSTPAACIHLDCTPTSRSPQQEYCCEDLCEALLLVGRVAPQLVESRRMEVGGGWGVGVAAAGIWGGAAAACGVAAWGVAGWGHPPCRPNFEPGDTPSARHPPLPTILAVPHRCPLTIIRPGLRAPPRRLLPPIPAHSCHPSPHTPATHPRPLLPPIPAHPTHPAQDFMLFFTTFLGSPEYVKNAYLR